MGLISCAKKYPVSTFHPKNPAMQDSILVFNQDCELVSQLPKSIRQKNFENIQNYIIFIEKTKFSCHYER